MMLYIIITCTVLTIMKRKLTEIVNNSTNIKKINNHLSPQIIDHKKGHNIWHWKFRSWLGTDTNMWWG